MPLQNNNSTVSGKGSSSGGILADWLSQQEMRNGSQARSNVFFNQALAGVSLIFQVITGQVSLP